MQEEVASFIAFQVRRATEHGDTELAMTKMRQFLELEREAKSSQPGSDSSNVRRFPALRGIS